jgi:predicted GH43/DUF377 family glycosyl hydrolase
MKKKFYFCQVMVVLIIVFFSIELNAQANWEKYEDNPVLLPGPAGSWDSQSVEGGSVLFTDNLYHIWYSGNDGMNLRIGHATSVDGIVWEKDTNNPVLDIGPAGSWDENNVGYPSVIIKESIFHMWYSGENDQSGNIGYAISYDGSTWVKDTSNPVLEVGDIGSWEEVEVFPMPNSVLYHEGQYKIWYGGENANEIYAIGYATSTDGVNWQKDSLNPIIEASMPPQFDWYNTVPGSVLFIDGLFHMWYSGCGSDIRFQVGHAVSSNGIDWIKDSINNPVIEYGSVDEWDFVRAWCGAVLYDVNEQIFKMWYSGGQWQESSIGYATSEIIGIEEISRNSSLMTTCYPNPFHHSVTLEYELKTKDMVFISIYNSMGQLVYTSTREQLKGLYKFTWEPEDLKNGLYFLTIQAGDFLDVIKVVRK